MAKRFAALAILLALFGIITGCYNTTSAPAQPSASEQQNTEPPTATLPSIQAPAPAPEPDQIPKPESMKTQPASAKVRQIPGTKPEIAQTTSPKTETKQAQAPDIKSQQPTTAPPSPQPQPQPPAAKAAAKKTETPKAEKAKPKPTSAQAFHNKCAEILSRFVDDKGMVDYDRLDLKRLVLKGVLMDFAQLDPNEYETWSQNDKIAFWINAYNMELLNIIVDNYPIQSTAWGRILWGPNSIRNIKGIWNKYKFVIMDEQFTLNQIENRFFRKEFDDPRIFFAIFRASLSGPPLRSEPYYGKKLDRQLDDQVRKFLSSPRCFRIDRKNRIIYLSALLQPSSYGQEFVAKYTTDKKFKDQETTVRAVLNFITNYIPQQDVLFLEVGNYSIDYIKYDWTLNKR